VPSGVAEQLERRRRAAAERWGLRDETVLIGAGAPLPIPGRGDRRYPFRSHSEYLYLTDRERPGGVLAFDPDDGWTDFVAPVTRDERLWEGASPTDEGVPVSELAGWLEARRTRPVACLGAPVEGVASEPSLESRLRPQLRGAPLCADAQAARRG
jgi:Aminopeptidase P, N-terminal domain